MNSKERCLAVLRGEQPDKIPYFPLFMFFASDRYKVTYTDYITQPDIMAEAQQLMHEKYKVDALSACSDSYQISHDLGGEVCFMGNQTPHLARPLVETEEDLKRLGYPDMDASDSRCRQRIDAIAAMHRNAGKDALVMGWVEMPFAEVCEWFGIQNFMYLLVDEPEFAHAALEKAALCEIEFAKRQIEAGADLIGCGDAASSLISSDFFEEFALPYEQRVNDAIREAGAFSKLHICGNSTHNLEHMADSHCDMVNIDYAVDFEPAADIFDRHGLAFKGNADPVRDILNASPEDIHQCALSLIKKANGRRYMLGAGCEIPADVSDEQMMAFYV